MEFGHFRWGNPHLPKGDLTIARQFTAGLSQLDKIVAYIRNQEVHPRKISFQEEFVALLKKHQIEYDERYLWE